MAIPYYVGKPGPKAGQNVRAGIDMRLHPRSCKHKYSRFPDKQCGKFALKGSTLCARHGGRRELTHRINRFNTLPHFYTKVLSRTLNEIVEEQLGKSPSEQHSVNAELALLQTLTLDTVQMFSALTSLPADKQNDSKIQAMIADARFLLREQLQEIAKMKEVASKVAANGAGKFSIESLQLVVQQIIVIAYECFQDVPEANLKSFEYQLREKIRMPEENKGTTILPDDDVMEMDDTVPRAPLRIESNGNGSTNGNGNGQH